MPEDATIETPPNFRDALKAGAEADKAAATGTPPEPPKEPVAPAKPPEAPKPPAAAPVADPDEEIISGKRSPKSDDFKRVKGAAKAAQAEAETYKAKVSDYEKRLAELEKRPAANADEIQKLKADHDRYKATVETVFVEGDPNFNKGYAERVGQINDGLKGLIPPEIHAKASQLFNLPDSEWKTRQLDELMSELSPAQQMKVMRADERVQEVLAERQSKINRSHETLGQLAESRQKQMAEQQAAMEKAFEDVAGKVTKENPLFQKKDGDEEWNAGVDERLNVAREVYRGKLKPEEFASWALSASSIKALAESAKAKDARIAELEGVVKKLQGSGPGMEGNGGSEPRGHQKSFSQLVGDAANEG